MVGGMRTKTLCLLTVWSLESRICKREREVPILLRWMRVYVDNVAITEDVVEKSGSLMDLSPVERICPSFGRME